MIYNPLYKDNPHTSIQIYDGAIIYVWETLEEYLHTAAGGERTTWSLHRAKAGIYWVNTILSLPTFDGVGKTAVCLYTTPRIQYNPNSMAVREYIAWGVLQGEYTVVTP